MPALALNINMQKTLRILGTRGVPAAHGGFETFAEYLSLYLVAKGWRVVVYCQEQTCRDLADSYPSLEVLPVCATLRQRLNCPYQSPTQRTVPFTFPGPRLEISVQPTLRNCSRPYCAPCAVQAADC